MDLYTVMQVVFIFRWFFSFAVDFSGLMTRLSKYFQASMPFFVDSDSS